MPFWVRKGYVHVLFTFKLKKRKLTYQTQSSEIPIIANDATFTYGEPWKPIWLHETELGHDKALSVNKARAEAAETCGDGEIPLIIFIGDGVSDLTAAREADVLFCRKGLKLEEYCLENKIPYIPFETFADVKKEVQGIMKEDQEKTSGTGVPHRFNPRANMWRRISSKQAVRSPSILHTVFSCKTQLLIHFRFPNSLLPLPPTRRRCSCGQSSFPTTSPRRFQRGVPYRRVKALMMLASESEIRVLR